MEKEIGGVVPKTRQITKKEQVQRGCVYCAYSNKGRRDAVEDIEMAKSERAMWCAFHACPYHELDGIENYLMEYDEPMMKNWKKAMAALVGG